MEGLNTTLTEWEVRAKIEANEGLFSIVQMSKLLAESADSADLEYVWNHHGTALVTAIHHVAKSIYMGPMCIDQIEKEGGLQFCRVMGYDEDQFKRDMRKTERKKAMDLEWLQLSESQQEELIAQSQRIKDADSQGGGHE